MKKVVKRIFCVILFLIIAFSVVVSLADPTIVLAEENIESQECFPDSILYVDGIGSGEKNGTSAANAYATLAEAYDAIRENGLTHLERLIYD